mmetsp:Transcript_39134/g.110833  ORF Transcript_39134/g.110833 Transcript_39134/m.110833 type:complete len:447 (+) Transcript_39134:219-1559(+)
MSTTPRNGQSIFRGGFERSGRGHKPQSGSDEPSPGRLSVKGARFAETIETGSPGSSGRGGPMKLKERIDNTNLMNMIHLSKSLSTLRDMGHDFVIPESSLVEVKLLGKGGFGSVQLCEYTSGDKSTQVAVKRINKELLTSKTDLDLFLKECALLKKLSHRNIVDFIGMGPPPTVDANGNPTGESSTYLVQEFCNSGSLQDMLNRQMSTGSTKLKSYTECDALEWLIDIAQGLKYLHGASPSVIHRDMKLENMFLSKSGGRLQVKLGDFGLSAICDKKAERHKHMRDEYDSVQTQRSNANFEGSVSKASRAAASMLLRVASKVGLGAQSTFADTQEAAVTQTEKSVAPPSAHELHVPPSIASRPVAELTVAERAELSQTSNISVSGDSKNPSNNGKTPQLQKLGSFAERLTSKLSRSAESLDQKLFNLTGQTGMLNPHSPPPPSEVP